MAYVSQPRQNQIVLGGGGGDAAPAASVPGQPQQQPSSGAFTDFGAYLRANGDASKQMAQRITQPIADKAADAAKDPSVQPLYGGDNPFAQLGLLQANAPVYNQNAQNVSDTNAKRDEASSLLNASAAPGWAQQQLGATAGPGYTPGMAQLDAYLANAGGASGQASALRQQYAGKLNPYTYKPTFSGTAPPLTGKPKLSEDPGAPPAMDANGSPVQPWDPKTRNDSYGGW